MIEFPTDGVLHHGFDFYSQLLNMLVMTVHSLNIYFTVYVLSPQRVLHRAGGSQGDSIQRFRDHRIAFRHMRLVS